MPATLDLLGPRCGSFRASLRALWVLSGALMLLLLPMVLRRIVVADALAAWQIAAIFGSLLLVPLLLFGFLAPAIWFWRVHVHELGLRAFDAWGRFHRVRWPTMLEADAVEMLVLPYLRVKTSEAGVTLFVPLFLAKRAEFERLVAERAGPLNPITRALARPGA